MDGRAAEQARGGINADAKRQDYCPRAQVLGAFGHQCGAVFARHLVCLVGCGWVTRVGGGGVNGRGRSGRCAAAAIHPSSPAPLFAVAVAARGSDTFTPPSLSLCHSLTPSLNSGSTSPRHGGVLISRPGLLWGCSGCFASAGHRGMMPQQPRVLVGRFWFQGWWLAASGAWAQKEEGPAAWL